MTPAFLVVAGALGFELVKKESDSAVLSGFCAQPGPAERQRPPKYEDLALPVLFLPGFIEDTRPSATAHSGVIPDT